MWLFLSRQRISSSWATVLLTKTMEKQPADCTKVMVDYAPNNVWNGANSYKGEVGANIMVCGTDPKHQDGLVSGGLG